MEYFSGNSPRTPPGTAELQRQGSLNRCRASCMQFACVYMRCSNVSAADRKLEAPGPSGFTPKAYGNPNLNESPSNLDILSLRNSA